MPQSIYGERRFDTSDGSTPEALRGVTCNSENMRNHAIPSCGARRGWKDSYNSPYLILAN